MRILIAAAKEPTDLGSTIGEPARREDTNAAIDAHRRRRRDTGTATIVPRPRGNIAEDPIPRIRSVLKTV